MTPDEAQEILRQRKLAYQLAVNQPAVQEMLRDLALFCRAVHAIAPETENVIDTNRMMMLAGRQQVWQRIEKHLNLTSQELFALYTGKPIQRGEEDNG